MQSMDLEGEHIDEQGSSVSDVDATERQQEAH